MNAMATNSHNVSSLPFRGGAYVAKLMAELSRVGIAQRIKRARLEAGLKQHELADVLHVHRNTVQNWESQRNPITPWDRLGELGEVLGVSRDWLIHGDHLNVDPQDALQSQVVDALRGVHESQEDVRVKLEHALSLLERLEGLLSTPRVPPQVPNTGGRALTDPASVRPQ